ncbi:mediator of RNA polymerase II transcription subunit 13 [Scaptodrosophila lebanonensis]|uniref:Mediator of RNA polymerase II transcription subunit 13 n=1 Tax=Drosophila lebanonensis TaxID=7225 RepID=A0A6J2U5Q0_DROLE|nr:mediator of RNA polymerase II transcription subunit 13 [Scaptodrosophila lebanonensis]
MFWPKLYPGIASLLWLLCLLQSQHATAFIVPQELPSLLSVVYSNIPPIKKGTDSRLGFGFRLGEHADFQVLVELGPQKNTRPIGEPSKDDQSFNKRQVSNSDQRALLRQQLQQQQEQQMLTSTERNAANWLETWSNGMKPQKHKPQKAKPRQPVQEGNPQLPQQPPVPQNAMQQLQLLYKMATSSSSTTTTTTVPPFAPLKLGAPSGFKLPPPALEQDTNALGSSLPPKSRAEITRELMDVSLEN